MATGDGEVTSGVVGHLCRPPNLGAMDVNAAVAAASAIAGLLTGVIAVLAFRWSERDQARPTRTALHTETVLPPGVDTVL